MHPSAAGDDYICPGTPSLMIMNRIKLAEKQLGRGADQDLCAPDSPLALHTERSSSSSGTRTKETMVPGTLVSRIPLFLLVLLLLSDNGGDNATARRCCSKGVPPPPFSPPPPPPRWWCPICGGNSMTLTTPMGTFWKEREGDRE